MEAQRVYRFDYARIRIATDHDVAQQRTKEMQEQLELYITTQQKGKEGGYQFRVFPGGEKGSRQYCVEIWGPLAEYLTWLDFEEWADRLMRVDVRANLPTGTPGTIRLLGDQLAEKKGRLNLTRYESKARSKRGGRSAGGSGLALGSHKSIFRASVYKRNGEAAALEFQWSGAASDTAVSTITSMRRVPDVDKDPWAALRRHLYVEGLERLQRATGLDYGAVLDILSGRVREEPEAVYEQLELGIKMDFAKLPEGRQTRLINMLMLTNP